MLEMEIKCRVADFSGVQDRLRSWGARRQEALQEADHYFNAPDRDFGKTDEALGIRRIGSKNRVTYKGPRRQGPAKVRSEIEVGLADGTEVAEDFARLLTSLGYRPTAVVRKERVAYRFQRDGFDLEVCLDTVVDVGRFVEIEIVAPESAQANAERVLQEVKRELQLEQTEKRSYLQMLLEKSGNTPLAPGTPGERGRG